MDSRPSTHCSRSTFPSTGGGPRRPAYPGTDSFFAITGGRAGSPRTSFVWKRRARFSRERYGEIWIMMLRRPLRVPRRPHRGPVPSIAAYRLAPSRALSHTTHHRPLTCKMRASALPEASRATYLSADATAAREAPGAQQERVSGAEPDALMSFAGRRGRRDPRPPHCSRPRRARSPRRDRPRRRQRPSRWARAVARSVRTPDSASSSWVVRCPTVRALQRPCGCVVGRRERDQGRTEREERGCVLAEFRLGIGLVLRARALEESNDRGVGGRSSAARRAFDGDRSRAENERRDDVEDQERSVGRHSARTRIAPHGVDASRHRCRGTPRPPSLCRELRVPDRLTCSARPAVRGRATYVRASSSAGSSRRS